MSDTDKIEENLRHERDALRANLHLLGAQFAPDRMVNQATQTAQVVGTKIAYGAVDMARQNKAPLAMTGAGLAWLAISATARSRPRSPDGAYDTRSRPTISGLRDAPPLGDFDDRVAAADRAMKREVAKNFQEGEYDMTYSTPDTDTTHLDRLRDTIESGLDGLPDGAKQRVRAAREAAISAQERAKLEASKAAHTVRSSAHDNPLLVGALAFAAGAALAAALPRTSSENQVIGRHRDRLFDEADRVLRDEKAKLTEAAKGAIAQGQAKVKEAVTGETAPAENVQPLKKMNAKSKTAETHA